MIHVQGLPTVWLMYNYYSYFMTHIYVIFFITSREVTWPCWISCYIYGNMFPLSITFLLLHLTFSVYIYNTILPSATHLLLHSRKVCMLFPFNFNSHISSFVKIPHAIQILSILPIHKTKKNSWLLYLIYPLVKLPRKTPTLKIGNQFHSMVLNYRTWFV